MSRLGHRPVVVAVLAALALVAAFSAYSPRTTSAAPAVIHDSSCGGVGAGFPNCSFENADNNIVIGPDSCNDDANACTGLGNGVQINAGGDPAEPGSCNGDDACRGLNAGAVVGGDACNGDIACQHVGSFNNSFSAGDGSCNGFDACNHAFARNSSFSVGAGSCIGFAACNHNLASNSSFSAGAGSCIGLLACHHLGHSNGSVSAGSFSCNTTNTNAATAQCRAAQAEIGDCMLNDEPPEECLPDVSVGVTCSPAEVAPGSNVTCVIEVRNATFVEVLGATMSTVTPPNTTFVSLTVPFGWDCPALPAAGGAGAIECDPALDPRSTHSFVLVLNVDAGTPDGTTITLTVSADATEDTNPDNNDASDSVTVVVEPEEPDEPEPTPAVPTPTPTATPVCCCCPVDLDLDVDNTNTNVIGIENENANNNANSNDNSNSNENLNANENTNANENAQDQTTEQGQDNANEQTNNITSSPKVNIDFGR